MHRLAENPNSKQVRGKNGQNFLRLVSVFAVRLCNICHASRPKPKPKPKPRKTKPKPKPKLQIFFKKKRFSHSDLFCAFTSRIIIYVATCCSMQEESEEEEGCVVIDIKFTVPVVVSVCICVCARVHACVRARVCVCVFSFFSFFNLCWLFLCRRGTSTMAWTSGKKHSYSLFFFFLTFSLFLCSFFAIPLICPFYLLVCTLYSGYDAFYAVGCSGCSKSWKKPQLCQSACLALMTFMYVYALYIAF